ncbi:hypothetical protein BC629DRAFT_1266338, partial [Irpex lacteus]
LSTPDFFCLGRVNSYLKKLTESCVSRRFQINRSLMYYFDCPNSFRLLQAQTGAVIAGSFALNFFTLDFSTRPDLDVYVSFEAGESVGTWLERNGYQFSPSGSRYHSTNHGGQVAAPPHPAHFIHAIRNVGSFIPDNFYVHGVMGVFEFIREVEGSVRRVQLVAVRRSPIETILRFDSTCALNFITFEKAYCLYPAATLGRRFNLV